MSITLWKLLHVYQILIMETEIMHRVSSWYKNMELVTVEEISRPPGFPAKEYGFGRYLLLSIPNEAVWGIWTLSTGHWFEKLVNGGHPPGLSPNISELWKGIWWNAILRYRNINKPYSPSSARLMFHVKNCLHLECARHIISMISRKGNLFQIYHILVAARKKKKLRSALWMGGKTNEFIVKHEKSDDA